MENPVISNHVDAHHALDEPAGGCIVQADELPMLSASAVDNDGSMVGTNSSLYWASMLKLMEQGSGATPTSTLSSCSTNQNAYYAGGQVLSTIGQHGGTSHASSTSSSVHDQPMESVLPNHGVSDPDNAVWGQEFLSTGPIAESCKPSLDDHLAACADDGLHELLYPRTVLELLFSDQLKLEQLTSWPDNRSFALPQAAASVNNPANQLQLPADPQLSHMMKPPVHFPISFPQFDDRLSSSTASSTLSDTTIDQWAAPPANSTVGQCENMHGRSSSAIHLPQPMQQHQQQQLPFDCTRVKVETPAATSPSNYYNSNLSTDINYHAGCSSKFSSPFLHSHNQGAAVVNHESMQIINEIDTKPALNNIANKLWPPPNGEHHAQLVTVSPRNHIYDQLIRSNQVGPHQNHGASSHDRFFNTHPVNQLGKKSRLEAIKRETIETMVHDTKISVNNIASGGLEEQKVPLSLENNFKRCRVDQASSAPLKSQPVRKEKLTERITTLQQLVSPFGKTDTASVLLEAIGYIKFLQEQVQALSSPYFKTGASQIGDKNSSGVEAKPDLKSRGLCLVPLSCTMQVANDNGADYWYGGAFR